MLCLVFKRRRNKPNNCSTSGLQGPSVQAIVLLLCLIPHDGRCSARRVSVIPRLRVLQCLHPAAGTSAVQPAEICCPSASSTACAHQRHLHTDVPTAFSHFSTRQKGWLHGRLPAAVIKQLSIAFMSDGVCLQVWQSVRQRKDSIRMSRSMQVKVGVVLPE